MMTTFEDDSFIWRGYLDKMSGTLENIRDYKYIQKAKQYSSIISEIDPNKFEEPVQQKKVREIVLFIKEAMKPDMERSNLKPIELPPGIIKRLNKSDNVPQLPPPVCHPVEPTRPSVILKKRRKRRRHQKKKK